MNTEKTSAISEQYTPECIIVKNLYIISHVHAVYLHLLSRHDLKGDPILYRTWFCEH